jgi:hypothetical protein
MPAQARALHARRIFAHAREGSQLSELIAGGRIIGEQLMHAVEQLQRFFSTFAFDGLGHQRRGRRRYGASLTLEANVADGPVVEFEAQRQVIAAHRVVAFDAGVGGLQVAEVARPAVVIEDHVAIKIIQFHGSL